MTLEDFLQQNRIGYEKHTHPLAYTAQALADVEHVSGYMVAKPVVVRSGRRYILCVVAAPKHVDLQRVAQVLGVPEAQLADERDLARLFPDCELGAEPPVGALFGLPTIMDKQLEEDEFLVMQAGTHTDAVKVRRSDWQHACRPQVAAIAR